MPTNDALAPIIDEVELLVAELREQSAAGLHFRIYHRFRKPGTVCAPGEEIAAICLVHRCHEYPLRLSLALRILFDYLTRRSRFPQSASQIEAGIRSDPFYTRHAANASGSSRFIRTIPRSFVRVYIARLRAAITIALREASLPMKPDAVLASHETVMNEIGYHLSATVVWLHERHYAT